MANYAETSLYTESENQLWDMLVENQEKPFFTAKNLLFTYYIKGNELFVSRKDKSITRSSINQAYAKAVELMQTVGCVSGPKKLGTFGASYIFSIFRELGIIKVS